MRRGAGIGLLAVAIVGGILAACFGSFRRPHPKNVLLIVVDTLRSNRLHCYGYPRATSPNVDRLAARGTLYERNYSQACWTLPSMSSMMSGRSIVDGIKALPASLPVLAESMRAGGFETAGFVANAVLGKASGFERGFDVYEAAGNVRAGELANRFSAWSDARRQGKPFFAWVQFIDPHEQLIDPHDRSKRIDPYRPDAAHDVFRGPRVDASTVVPRWTAAMPRLAELSPDPSTPGLDASIEKATVDSNRYDGEVLAVDDGIGTILQALERSGALSDTLVLFASDHGEMLYEHPVQPLIVDILGKVNGGKLPDGVLDLFGRGHRPWYFEDLWRTPLILAGPGIPEGVRRRSLSANLDISATILDSVGLVAAAGHEGRSLFGGRESGRERVFAYGHETAAVIEASGAKAIVHPPRMFLLPKDAPSRIEVHDVAKDPLEEEDVAEARPADRDRLAKEIAEWRARSPHFDPSRVSPEQLNTLHNLGYTDDGK